jgi:hypothetical protein
MGKKHSKPEYIDVYAPPDPIFIDIGCLGLLRYEYSEQDRMGSAPFLTVSFKAATYREMFTKVLLHLEKVATKIKVADPKALIPGPVYLFSAYDFELNNIECWLHFPNLNKKTGTLYQTQYERGVYNRWMHRLITHSMYKMNSSPACKYHLKYNRTKLPKDQQSKKPPVEPVMPSSSRKTKYVRVPSVQGETNTFMFGCRSTESARCLQSKSIHKKMGIYKDDKKPFHYPNIYFRVYRLNTSDARVKSFFDPTSMTRLVRNILPAGLDMNVGCLSGLVSPNNMYSFAVGNRRFGLYRNMDLKACSTNRVAIYERKFKGYMNTRMVIEDSILMVYSQPGEGSSEQPVFSMRIAPQNAELPLALVLEDDGSVKVYDRNNKSSELISSEGQLRLTDGTEYDMLEDKDSMGFDTVAEYKRRLENLHAYLRSINVFIQGATGLDLAAANVPVPAQVMEDLPPYDPDMDYVFRWNEWLNYLVTHHSVTKADILPYYINTTTREIAQQQAYKARMEQERGARNAEQQLDEDDQADMADDSAGFKEVSADDADALEAATDERIKARDAADKEREDGMKGTEYGMADYDPTTQPRQELPPIDPASQSQSTPLSRSALLREQQESASEASVFGVSLASITPQPPAQYQPTIHPGSFDTVLEDKQRKGALLH